MFRRPSSATRCRDDFPLKMNTSKIALSGLFLTTWLASAHAQFANYITRNVDQLYDGSAPFRFISYNGGTSVSNYAGWEASEQEDFFYSVQQLGGTVVRFMPPYHAGTATTADDALITGYSGGQLQYNELNWRKIDKAMQLAQQYGIRIIIPTLFNHSADGDSTTWSGYVGKTSSDFYNCDVTALSAYKQFLSWWANRTNYYTGVQYKNDKTILCWETGNEQPSTAGTWVANIAAYTKSIDPNHLVMDGRKGVYADGLSNANVDIVSQHYYWLNPTSTLQTDWNTAKGKKAFISGEFGFINNGALKDFVQAVDTTGMSGALFWILQPHSDFGGFVEWSCDQSDQYDFQGCRWPGFASGNGFAETADLTALRAEAYAIRGLSVPAVAVPAAPTNLRIYEPNVPMLSWRGSTGASGYNIQRATSASGPWTTIATNVSDAVAPSKSYWHESQYPAYNDGPALFSDTTAALNTTYFYRITAANASGTSAASNIVTTNVQRLAIIDELADFTKTASHSSNLGLEAGFWREHRDDRDRVMSTDGNAGSIVYSVPQDMVKFYFEAMPTTTSITGTYLNLTVTTSKDNVTYTPITCNKTSYTSTPYGAAFQRTPFNIYRASTQIPVGTRYLKIQLNDSAVEILRAEVEYGASTPFQVNAEVEDLRVATSSGDLNSPFNETAASSGAAVTYNSNGVGDFVVYRVYVPSAGTYDVSTTFKKGPNRGVCGLSIASSQDGIYVNAGNQSTDLYSASLAYVAIDEGTVNFSAAGDYYFKYTVTGKDGFSSGWLMYFDVITIH